MRAGSTLTAASALALATCMSGQAHAQIVPTTDQCRALAALEVAWQNFDTQDVNASLDRVTERAQQVSLALDQIAPDLRALSPAAFDQLKLAHEAVEAQIDAIPDEATPQQIEDRIRMAKDDERFAYQTLITNIVCP